MFRRTIFWQFVDIDLVFSSPIVYHMLLSEVKHERVNSMSFSIREMVVTFLKDFFFFTDNWFMVIPTGMVRNEETSKELESKYFGNRSRSNSFHINVSRRRVQGARV